jgi:hypothetical protein
MKTIPKNKPLPSEAVDEPNILSSGMGAPPVSRGHHVHNHLPEDDLTTERSVAQGVEDAEDDSGAQEKNISRREN